MSRHAKMSESPAPSIYDATPEPSSSRRLAHPNTTMQPMSLSPAGSTSSDKENRTVRTVNGGKGKERAVMAPPRRSEPEPRSRKRTAPDRVEPEERHQRRRTIEVDEEESEEEDSTENYDPDQNIEERRELRKNLRDASKNLMDNRSEFLKPTSTGLIDALKRADKLSENVKQTADATIDSRMLVNAADLSYKKTLALTTGDSATGVDVDEFVSKCITYMKKAVGGSGISTQAPSNTQRRRRANAGNDSDGEGDEGDMLNWEHLGRFACLPNNSRPPVPGFLLGPLSVEKRARKVAARRAALRPDRLQETRPEVLEAKDIGKSGDGNLTTLTMNIHGRLRKVIKEATAAVQDEYEEGMSEKEQMALCDRHSLSIDGGIALFKFVVNPHSFGQTVENLFYVSFLIRDGKVGIDVDDNGMPFLNVKAQRNGHEPTDQGAQKYQAVLAIDMDSWQSLIELFDITESMIPHREEVVQGELAARGWYA